MKKVLRGLLIFISSFVFIANVYADSANIGVAVSTGQTVVGNQVNVSVTVSSSKALGAWDFSLNYDNGVFKLVSGNTHVNDYVDNNSTYSRTYNYTFQAINSGSGRFYIDSSSVADFDENFLQVVDGSKTVNVITYADYEASLSKNNNLASLSVEGYEITPEFNKDIDEYSVKVNEDEKSIKIIAKVEDGASSVTGDGEVEVSPGNNSFNIVVIAENGSEKTYKLNVEVIDKNPIEVTVDGKKYTVVKIKENLEKPKSYEEKTIKIKEFDIPAFYNDKTKFTLIGLKDEKGKVNLYIYDKDKYTKYNELDLGNITLYALPMSESLDNYTKKKITIQNEEVEALVFNNNKRFSVIYAMNVETGNKDLYLYDSKENTAVKYDSSYSDMLNEKVNILMIASIVLGSTTLLSLIIIIVLASKRGKKVSKNDKKDNDIKQEESSIDEDNTIEEVKEDVVEEEISEPVIEETKKDSVPDDVANEIIEEDIKQEEKEVKEIITEEINEEHSIEEKEEIKEEQSSKELEEDDTFYLFEKDAKKAKKKNKKKLEK